MLSQGQSDFTIRKEATFATCLGWTLQRVRSTSCRKYFAFDLNCGCGHNVLPEVITRGTSLLLYDHLKKRGINAELYCCDSRKIAVEALKYKMHFGVAPNLFGGIRPYFICGDNRDFAGTMLQRVKESGVGFKDAWGVVVADPNGLEVPISEIGRCISAAPKIDVFIHLSGFVQVWSYWKKHPEESKFRGTPRSVKSIRSVLQAIPKTMWLISEIDRAGRGHVLLFGSYWYDIPGIKDKPGRLNMYRIDSERGKELVEFVGSYATQSNSAAGRVYEMKSSKRGEI
jgi:hypothetical protein